MALEASTHVDTLNLGEHFPQSHGSLTRILASSLSVPLFKFYILHAFSLPLGRQLIVATLGDHLYQYLIQRFHHFLRYLPYQNRL